MPFRRTFARCAEVLRKPVVPKARCASVGEKPVVLCAGSGQPDRVLRVVQIDARCAGCDTMPAWFRLAPVVQA